MILKDREKLIKEIQETFDNHLANAGIRGLSGQARNELLDKITSHIDYLYFPSACQLLMECMMVIPMLLRCCLSACSGFKITLTDQDSAELRGLPKSQISALTLSMRGVLEKYRDWAEEERIAKEAAAQRQTYSDRASNTTSYSGAHYTPSYQSSGSTSAYSRRVTAPAVSTSVINNNTPSEDVASSIADLKTAGDAIGSLISKRR